MQLVAYGAQDIYLTGNPQITFFKVVYRRHTNFSMESIEQTFSGTPTSGGTVVATISRNGDLVSHLYVEFDPSAIIVGGDRRFAPNFGHELLKEMEIEIGGQRIDRQYSHWLNAYNFLHGELRFSATRADNAQYPIAPVIQGSGSGVGCEVTPPPTMYQKMSFNVKHGGATSASMTPVAHVLPIKYACVPLQFWFCRNPGLALPLIALQYHEVKVKLTLAPIADLITTPSSGESYSSIKLFADYIYLDTDERRRFAQVSHEYLIEQVQYQLFSSGQKFDLNFNHPVKELIWAGQRHPSSGLSTNAGRAALQDLVKADTGTTRLRDTNDEKAILKLNGHDRFSARADGYFTRTQVWQHHHGAHTGDGGGDSSDFNGDAVHVYSFALKPEEHQPSGTCNFSRIDNAQLVYDNAVGGNQYSTTYGGVHVYAVNYNVLRIMSGMSGLAYSN